MRWNDDFWYRIPDLVASGMSKNAVAAALGTTAKTVTKWVQSRPILAKRVKEIRAQRAEKGVETFFEYVHKTLPPELVPIWNQIVSSGNDPGRFTRVTELLERHGRVARQRLFLHALVSQNFVLSDACRLMCVPTSTAENWIRDDPDFSRLYQYVMGQAKKDFFESALMHLVAVRDPAATLMVNKTVNRDRGYNEKIDVNLTGSVDVNATVRHEFIDPVELGLPNNVLEQILNAYREKHAPQTKPNVIIPTIATTVSTPA